MVDRSLGSAIGDLQEVEGDSVVWQCALDLGVQPFRFGSMCVRGGLIGPAVLPVE